MNNSIIIPILWITNPRYRVCSAILKNWSFIYNCIKQFYANNLIHESSFKSSAHFFGYI